MTSKFTKQIALICLVMSLLSIEAEARRRSRRRSGPAPTNPVVLWARTLSNSDDREQRKVAAFKLSAYSLVIFQEEAVSALIKCIKDTDVEIKVFCAKAMGKAGNQSQVPRIRKVMLETYENDPSLRNTLTRAFIVRKDSNPEVQEVLLNAFKKSEDQEEQLALLGYFENYGSSSKKFTDVMVEGYQKNTNTKVRSAIVSAVSTKAEGQESVVSLLAQCAQDHENLETPLVLTCISGLQQQSKKDQRTWAAIEKTIESDDNDVVMSTLELISVLPENPHEKIAQHLIKLIDETEDEDTLEKAVLSLGVCGDHSQPIVNTLQGLMEKKSTPEGVRVATALVMGKQSDKFPEAPRSLLSQCSKEGKSQSLKTACQLGLREIEGRQKAAAAILPVPAVVPPREVTAESTISADNKKPESSEKAPGPQN